MGELAEDTSRCAKRNGNSFVRLDVENGKLRLRVGSSEQSHYLRLFVEEASVVLSLSLSAFSLSAARKGTQVRHISL